MQKFQLFPLLLTCFLLASCSQQPDDSSLGVDSRPTATTALSPEIAETSGLACLDDGTFLTINDSGNPAMVYQLDTQGRIIDRHSTDAQNQDWEALAVHQGQLWIADIGNNSGQRPSLQLYRAVLPTRQSAALTLQTLQLRYPTPPKKNPAHYQHGQDAEALVSNGDQLLLFSKNWLGMQSQVYLIDTQKTNAVLLPVGTTSALPGLITDIAYSAQYRVYVAVGYQNFRLNPLAFMLSGDFSPFIAVLDTKFQLINTKPVETAGQLEAVCLDQAQNIWLSQEQSSHQPAQFWRWGPLATLTRATD